jgi:type II secretory pathway pseudopilin PulG
VAKIRRDDGFILLEVLISLVMIGFLMGSLTFMYARSTGIQAQQAGTATAEEVASSRMEQIRVLDPSAITAGSASSTISGIVFTVTWTPDVCWQAADPAAPTPAVSRARRRPTTPSSGPSSSGYASWSPGPSATAPAAPVRWTM